MTSIAALKKRLDQLNQEKAALQTKVSATARKNADARKYALGGALLKLATTDQRANAVLKQVWAMSAKDRPRVFDDTEFPLLEIRTTRPDSEVAKSDS